MFGEELIERDQSRKRSGRISRPSAQGLFIRAVFERMVLPREVGGAADFGLIGRTPATDRAIRLHGGSKRILGKAGKCKALA
ncbi:hypothetical protein MTR72_33730 [Bradyrhizobium sp. ISRA442]|uniref:hypothetical protein n=1 Tax=Bradyrhizobium sp. ISRA442 TaxID=2866197 RepID=UPI00311B0D73